jgi:hypothetical protein
MAAINNIAKFTSGTKLRKPVVILETSSDAKREIHLGDKNISNL